MTARRTLRAPARPAAQPEAARPSATQPEAVAPVTAALVTAALVTAAPVTAQPAARPSSRTALSLRIFGRTSGLIGSASKSASHRSGVISG